MSGLGMVLNTAKSAIAANQYGLSITGHNIANVNTPEYSRQTLPLTTASPHEAGNLFIGTGVDMEQVKRSVDEMLEGRLTENTSDLAAYDEMSKYLSVLESYFNENSEGSISNLMTTYWNSWQDLANNTVGAPERVQVFGDGVRIAEQFDTLNNQLQEIETTMTTEIETAVAEINSIASELASVNYDIIGVETNRSANDLLDKRTGLLRDLAEIIDVKTYEQSDGSLTVSVANGFVLVNGFQTFDIEMSNQEVAWQSSDGGSVEISDKVLGGKIGGWLSVRDEILPKYKSELDELAKELVWSVNKEHSEGVGLDFFKSQITGTNSTATDGQFSTLEYGNRIDYTKDFKLWAKDENAAPPDYQFTQIDMSISDSVVSNWNGPAAGATNYKYVISVTQSGTVGPGADDPILTWEKYTPQGAAVSNGTFSVTDVDTLLPAAIDGLSFDIAAGNLYAGNTFTINTDAAGNPDPLALSSPPGGYANNVSDAYLFKVKAGTGGTIGTDPITIEWSNSITSGSFELKDTYQYPYSVELDGMDLRFNTGTLFDNDIFTIETDDQGVPTLNNPTDWHWTLESFKDQFNRQSARVTAAVTTENTIEFTPYELGTRNEMFNIQYTNDLPIPPATAKVPLDFTQENVSITINNYDAFTLTNPGPQIQIARPPTVNGVGGLPDPNDVWSLQNNPGYAVTFQPLDGLDMDNGFIVELDGIRAFTVEFQNPPVSTNGNLGFDIQAASSEYSFGFGDDGTKGFSDSGVAAALGVNTFFAGSDANTIQMNSVLDDIDYIATAKISSITGEYGIGDNNNANIITDLQYQNFDMARFTYKRGSDAQSKNIQSSQEDFYQSMLGSLGIQTQNITRAKEHSEVMVEKIQEQRDEVSAVSLDEEMVNLIQYQHAFTVASKLMNVADEMLTTLINTR